MPNTPYAAIPFPAPGTPPATRSYLQRIATTVDAWLKALDVRLASERSGDRKEALDAARVSSLVRAGVIGGTTNAAPVVVATGKQGLPGCAVNVPTGVAVIITGYFDVACSTYNGACTFEGRIVSINRDTMVAETINRPAVWRPGGNDRRAMTSQVWLLGPADYPRTIQANVSKSSTGADLQADVPNTSLQYLYLQNGV